MEAPQELSLSEIHKYMLANGCRVTNHALVKHFKRFLTHPETQIEARKEFKTYVNILATIKNENNQKYLILRKKYVNEGPVDGVVKTQSGNVPNSPGTESVCELAGATALSSSPVKLQPPPYKPPPEVSPSSSPHQSKLPVGVISGNSLESNNVENYRDCINEFATAKKKIDPTRSSKEEEQHKNDSKITAIENLQSKAVDDGFDNKENIPKFSYTVEPPNPPSAPITAEMTTVVNANAENPMSVKEATRKFNRLASEEEAKIATPPNKKKMEKSSTETKALPEVTMTHPKAKEWIVTMAKGNYQELAKLLNDYPELVKLADPSTSYTALHWAAKHGNEDVVKLIAGTHKGDVNARTNGGYTPLHIAMQLGRANIFALLCNTYKANRDILDWSGKKPLDYSKQQTSVSASTYSKIKAKRKSSSIEKDSGFLRIGSLNVRVRKTTEAFSHFLGVGNSGGNTMPTNHYHQRHHHHHYYPPHHHHRGSGYGVLRNPDRIQPMVKKSSTVVGARASIPINVVKYDQMLHKSWGSADNIPQRDNGEENEERMMMMPPPVKSSENNVKRRTKQAKRSPDTSSSSANTTAAQSLRGSISSTSSALNYNTTGYSSMPTTPNQFRSPMHMENRATATASTLIDSDSDSACGFDSNWSINKTNTSSNSNNDKNPSKFT